MLKSKKKTILFTFLILIVISLSSFGVYYLIRSKTPRTIKPFQDPFMFNNGTRVSTIEDWEVRRNEIKETLLSIEYGHIPMRPDALKVTLISQEPIENLGKLQILNFAIIPKNSTPQMTINYTIWLFTPNGTGPFPAVIKVAPDGTGSQAPINRTMLQRGYIYACYNHTQLDPDTQGYDIVGSCQTAYPDYDWATLAVWAWGAMRVVDFLVGEPWVESSIGFPSIKEDHLIVTGHSRRGKTALIAAAFDERIDVAAPNGSGCGGAGSYLVQGMGAETLESITSERKFKAWFHGEFGEYGGKEKELPFDQHFLRALIAPRLIISNDGLADLWANPMGTHAVHLAAQPVFDFLNVSKNNAIHFREGGHAFLAEDFQTILDFAEYMLDQKESTMDFYNSPFSFKLSIPYSAPN